MGSLRSLCAGLAIVLVAMSASSVSFGQDRYDWNTDYRYVGATDEARAYADLIRTAAMGRGDARHAALEELIARDAKDAIGALIVGMRHVVIDDEVRIALSELAGAPINNWYDAMIWQEANPQVEMNPVTREIKLRVFMRHDARFMRFLGGELSRDENMRIRLDEITWGGVMINGIPALTNPRMETVARAESWMGDDNLVFGVSINGDHRAYPLRIMGWHEMVNDVVGGVPVSLAYCTLCGAGILFETGVEGQGEPFTFDTSGLLYRSNKLMFDTRTDSLWNQFSGEPVTGPLAFSGIKLNILPMTVTSWADWRDRHPETTVLSLATGHLRDYRDGVTYADYFASPDLLFPAVVGDESVVLRKDFVFGVRDVGAQKAWPLDAFATEPVINDALAGRNLVLIGDASTRDVRAYERGDNSFEPGDTPDALISDGETWTIEAHALVGPDGTQLARVPGHLAFWFGWNNHMGVESELYVPKGR